MNGIQVQDDLQPTLAYSPIAGTRGASAEVTVSGASTPQSSFRHDSRDRRLGPYRLGLRLGAGGMGEVYEAEHVLLKRPCAIKFIKPQRDTDEETLDRFEQEVRATARLTHWNTVEIYDYGRTEDGTFYYVMELLPGLSLGELVKRHGPLPPQRVVHFLRQVCGALREAHAFGLVHRDLTPANIFAATRGGVHDVSKLLDFGLVKQAATAATETSGLLRSGHFSGSPPFMSPEQATTYNDADQRSDIYSLGAVAYYLLTGNPPFSGKTALQVIEAHARQQVVPPSQILPGIPADLEEIILRCLRKNADERFQDVQSLKSALGHCESAGKWTEEEAADWWQQVERS